MDMIFDGNREAWLTAMVAKVRPLFLDTDATIPAEVRISCGFPSRMATSTRKRRIGECWHEAASSDGTREMFISPVLAEAVEVGATVVHEMVHAAGIHGHGKEFGKVARKLGLTGKMTATVASDALAATLRDMADEIGAYPHAAMDPKTIGGKKQSTRMLKVACPECGYTVRTTAKWIEQGVPTCPCGSEMETAA